MIAAFIYAVIALQSAHVEVAIERLHPNLPDVKRAKVALLIVMEAHDHDIDPLLVVSLIDRESDFRNLPKNRTKDYGIMQVHWQKAAWLKGLRPKDLMNPSVNIRAGVQEMAYWRRRCNGKRGPRGHHWIGHYKWGNVVKNRRYGRGVLRTYRKLRRGAEAVKAKSRRRRALKRPNKPGS